MSSVSKLLWLSCLACAFACTVPTIDKLEEERATECNAEHPCPPKDFVCFENRCIRTTGLGCVPGTSKACGSDVGECMQGTTRCDAKGEWGPCVGEVAAVAEVCNGKDDDCDGVTDDEPQTSACEKTAGVCAGWNKACVGGREQACTNASYGPDHESYFEITCDGKDNDCDGSIDEQIVKECAKTAGVCRGSVESCTDGRFEGCSDATYLAHHASYQRYETKCDGLDNDCDDKADAWDAIPLIAEHTSELLDAIAVKPSSAPEAVLTLTGESNGLVARTFTSEGLLNTGAKFPAPTSNVQFLSPALAEERDLVVAAWIERTTTIGSSSTYRVLMTLLDGTGNRIANVPLHNVSPYNDDKTRPSRLWLSINATHILLVLETLPEGFGARELWALTVARGDFRVRSTPLKLGGSSVSHWGPALTPNFARDGFLVAYEDSNGRPVMGRLLNDGTLSTVPPGPAVGSFAHSPFIVPTDSNGSYTLYYVNWPDTASDSTTLMQVSCSSTGCGNLKPIHTYFHHIRSMQMVTRPGMRSPELALLRWENEKTVAKGLSVALFPSGNFLKIADPLQLGLGRTYSEVLALPPSGGPRLVYLQEPAFGIGVMQANLRPFCP
jgi:hypothetical protein